MRGVILSLRVASKVSSSKRNRGIWESKMLKTFIGSMAALLLVISAPALAEKTTGERVDDSSIATSVKAGLLAEKGVPSNDVNVEVYKSIVLLSGFVTSQSQKDTAERIAKGVSGVTQVRNAIAVHPSTSMGTKIDDTMLVSKVKAALIDAKDVKSGQINVEARGGNVQLGGFVTSKAMGDRALKIAKAVAGVKRVDDALFVKPE
jgi:hyperosmotically inducible protein